MLFPKFNESIKETSQNDWQLDIKVMKHSPRQFRLFGRTPLVPFDVSKACKCLNPTQPNLHSYYNTKFKNAFKTPIMINRFVKLCTMPQLQVFLIQFTCRLFLSITFIDLIEYFSCISSNYSVESSYTPCTFCVPFCQTAWPCLPDWASKACNLGKSCATAKIYILKR